MQQAVDSMLIIMTTYQSVLQERRTKVQYIMFYNHVCTEEEDVSVDGISLGSPSVVITGRQQRGERKDWERVFYYYYVVAQT